ncbi:hypothetical protein BH10ACI1_BH10ACI1_10600 [soil metagenome]
MFLRFKTFTLFTLLLLTVAVAVFAQEKTTEKPKTIKSGKTSTAEQIAESGIFGYGFPGGRETLKQIRKTTFERGKFTQINGEGKSEKSNFERYIVRAESLDKEKIRFEQEFPNVRFGLISDGEKIFGVLNDTIFTPRDDAMNSFQNQIFHGLEALLRYKENGSEITLGEKEKIMGVEFYPLDVTDKQSRKTRFFVSAKSFRVMMLEYTEGGVKYVRKFYDYNYAQGTLVPYRTVLWANDKQVEELET